jgi:putative sterol carrier protein
MSATAVRTRALLDAGLASGGHQLARIDNDRAARRLALRLLPRALKQRFDATAAAGLDATIELRILASPGGGERRFTLRITDGELTVAREASAAAQAWLAASLADMILVVTGSVPWTAQLAAGKFELGGDPFVALRVPGLMNFRG